MLAPTTVLLFHHKKGLQYNQVKFLRTVRCFEAFKIHEVEPSTMPTKDMFQIIQNCLKSFKMPHNKNTTGTHKIPFKAKNTLSLSLDQSLSLSC